MYSMCVCHRAFCSPLLLDIQNLMGIQDLICLAEVEKCHSFSISSVLEQLITIANAILTVSLLSSSIVSYRF